MDLKYYTYREAIEKLGLNIKTETFGRWVTDAKKVAQSKGQTFRPLKRKYLNDKLLSQMFDLLGQATAAADTLPKSNNSRGYDAK